MPTKTPGHGRGRPRPGNLHLMNRGGEILAERASLDDVRSAQATRLLDVRSVEEFTGRSEVDDRPGHIPGATNIVWRTFSGSAHGYLDSAENIKHRLSDAGISEGDSVITYCRVGMRAALGHLALQQIPPPTRSRR